MSGWIKLHRSILKWEWADDPKTLALWVHLLLMSNHDTQNWRGIKIERGQLLTGRKKLSKITGLTEKEIRLRLNRLKRANQVAIKTANHYSIITICNYEAYQAREQEEGPSKGPARGPAEGQQRATNKNDKNEKKKRKEPTAKAVRVLIKSVDQIVLPSWLDTPAYKQSLQDWLDYKAARGESYKTQAGVLKIVEVLDSERKLKEAVDKAMANNWAGCVFGNKADAKAKANAANGDDEEDEATIML